MAGSGTGNVKLGFFVGLGLLLAFALGGMVQGMIGKVRGGAH